MMSSLLSCLLSQNTPLWSPPMTPKSPRRGPRGRVNSPCCHSLKTRRLRHDTSSTSVRPTNKGTWLPVYCASALRRDHNGLNLLATDRPQGPHCLLIRQSHGPCSRRNLNSNPLRIHWSTHSHNCTWADFFCLILLSKHQL